MQVTLRAISEDKPGPRWRESYESLAPGYVRWFLKEGDAARPSYLASLRALRNYMPELVPTYERLVELAGGGDLPARLLSLYKPTPYLTGCSQAVWTRDTALLARNYDYSPKLWDAMLWRTQWNERRVIAMTDCFWGVLDGINDAGLAVSLAFGGSKTVGDGFGIPLVLRYILEFCESTDEAAKVLQRVPSHMAYNITILDRAQRHATVYVAPGGEAVVTPRKVATNHQRNIQWRQFAHATATLDRENFLRARTQDADETATRFVQRFVEPPLYFTQFQEGWGTLYSAVYEPDADACARYFWPGRVLPVSFDAFQNTQLEIDYAKLLATK